MERSQESMAAPDAGAQTDAATPQRLHPLTLLYRLVKSIPGFAFLVFFALNRESEGWGGVISAAIYGVITVPILLLNYFRFRFWVTPTELVIESGVFSRNHRSIPVDRIQNVEIQQSVVQRMLGIARVAIETAGSSSTEGVFEYISLENATRIRETIRFYQRQIERAVKPAETPTDAAHEPQVVAEEEHATVIYQMSLRDVLLSGMFRFSPVYIALVFTVLGYLDVLEVDILDLLSERQLEYLAELGIMTSILLGLAGLFVAIFLAWLTGIAITLNRFYGFHLSRDGDKLHKRHGLLTRAEGTIPLKKVQLLILRSNPAMRFFQRYTLEAQMMGLETTSLPRSVVIPFARLAEMLRLAPGIYPFQLPETFMPVSRRFIRRVFIRCTMLYAVPIGLVALSWTGALWGLVVIPFFYGIALLQYRCHGYALDERVLFVRRGFLRQRVWIVPIEKLQVIYLAESFFQRRLGLKTMHLDVAGNPAYGYPRIVELDATVADALLVDLYERFRGVQGEIRARRLRRPRRAVRARVAE